MSALQKIRDLIKPDIEEIVEQRIAERLPSIIEALYPSIMEHVANNLYLVNHGSSVYDNSPKQELNAVSLQIRTSPGTVKYLGPTITTLDGHHYTQRINALYTHIEQLNDKLSKLQHESSH